MASSKDAFFKFGTWKNSRTVLKLTVFTKEGKPDIWRGTIVSVDESRSFVGFVDEATRQPFGLDLRDSSFKVGEDLVEVVDPSTGRLVFEKLRVS